MFYINVIGALIKTQGIQYPRFIIKRDLQIVQFAV